MDSKIIYLGHAQRADRMVWVPVLSESDSAPPWSKNGSCEDADPRSLDWHGCANPSFFEKIITLFQ
jgi:hypothetical protein